jgi:hypothetical protein
VFDWSYKEAAAQYLAFGITVAEGAYDRVPVKEFRAARDRMLEDPVARRHRMSSLWKTSAKALVNFESLSRIRNRIGVARSSVNVPMMLRACSVVHVPVGFAVTPAI